MMMISSRSAAAARAGRARLIAFILLVLLLGAAALWRPLLSGGVWKVLAPIMSARYSSPGLEAALASTTAALADRDALFAENKELKKRLGRDPGVPRVLAGVLLRPPATPYDTLVIDAGFKDGIARGDAVTAGGTTVIGEVTDLYDTAARVTLYSASGEKYDALLHLRSGESVPIVIEGQGGGSLKAMLPSGTEVQAGDYAVLPGLLGGLTAKVTYIDESEAESFSAVYLSLPVNPSTLRFVEVLKRPSHDTE
jgi:cell shape-determining protein MreC